jgi:creatinine amidohydrolase/Fe(II)-dependent formamide hydrolase-like protein
MTAAFSEIYHAGSLREASHGPIVCKMRNWWELPGVGDTCRQFFPVGEGHHATPSEISVTYYAYPNAQKQAVLEPRIAPFGPINDAADYRRRFPDGRIGSDPSQANPEAGEKIVAAAVKAVVHELRLFVEEEKQQKA